VVRDEGGEVSLRIQVNGDLRPAIVRAVVSHGVDLLRLDRSASRLESIFIQLARGDGRSLANGTPADTTGRPS
jgi:hypothetical protein